MHGKKIQQVHFLKSVCDSSIGSIQMLSQSIMSMIYVYDFRTHIYIHILLHVSYLNRISNVWILFLPRPALHWSISWKTWQKMTTLVLSRLIAAFFTGKENLFRLLKKTWVVPGHLHGLYKIEEVRFLIKVLLSDVNIWQRTAVTTNIFALFQPLTLTQQCWKELVCLTYIPEKVQRLSLYFSLMETQPQVTVKHIYACTNVYGHFNENNEK